MRALKFSLLSLLTLILVLALVFFAGPRVDTDISIRDVNLPPLPELEDHLESLERRFADLKPGTEKRIVWAGPQGEKTDYAIVYLHGFSATRQEAAPWPEDIARALNANLFETRFAGHGRSNEAMLEGSVNNWINDAYEALKVGQAIGDKVIILGVSTGATAATWLAQNFPEDPYALILMSPNFAPRDSRSVLLTWPWGAQIAEFIIGTTRSWEPYNDLQAEYWTHTYPTRALLPMMGLVKIVNQGPMEAITSPTLIIHSTQDEVISSDAVELAFKRLGSANKSRHIFNSSSDPSHHVLAGDILSPDANAPLQRIAMEFIDTLP